MSDNSLVGSLPSQIGLLTNLSTLYFDRNKLTQTLPTELGNLIQLTELSTYGNRFPPVLSPPWLRMKNLGSLQVDQVTLADGLLDLCLLESLSTVIITDLNITCYPACAWVKLGRWQTPGLSRCWGDEDKAVCSLLSSTDASTAMPKTFNGATSSHDSYHPADLGEKNFVTLSDARAVSFTLDFSPLSSFLLAELCIVTPSVDCQRILEPGTYTVNYASPTVLIRSSRTIYVYGYGVWGYFFTATPQYPRTGWACSRPSPDVLGLSSSITTSSALGGIVATDTSYATGLCQGTYGWTGVTCTQGMVTDIDLNSLNIAGPIPEDMLALFTLKGLDLHANAFTGTLPSRLSKSLINLDLSFNKLTGTVPASLGTYTKLSVVSLDNNLLRGEVPLSLAALTEATSLSLAGNQLTGKVPSELCVLGENNVTLDLSGNPLSCYESCWDSVDTHYWRFGAISVCAPTSQPSSSPTGMPFRVPTPAPTVVSARLASIVTPLVVGCTLIVSVLLVLLTRSRRAKASLLSTLPVHRMLQQDHSGGGHKGWTVEDILDVAAKNVETLCLLDFEGRSVLDLAIASGDEDLVCGVIQLTLPVDPNTKMITSESIHGYFWVTLVQRDDQSPVVERILETNVEICNELSKSVDQRGRPALNIASPICHRLIELSRYLRKRYEVDEQPVHISATCRVHLAVDHEDDKRRVALKFMRNKEQFDREQWIRQSGSLSDEYVVSITEALSGDDDESFGAEMARRGFLTHPHMLVMAAADKNLSQIILTERVASENWTQIHFIAQMLGRAVESLHGSGVIHGDIKPSNIVRIGGSFKLIDLDASSRIGVDFTGHKHSTAYMPPELLYESQHGSEHSHHRVGIRKNIRVRSVGSHIGSKGCGANDSEYDYITSDGSHDIWSLGVVFYELFSGTKLFLSNFEDNMADEDLVELYDFTDSFKEAKLMKIHDTLARNLVSQMLTRDPLKRPHIAQVLSHPFVSGQKATRLIGEKAEFDVFVSYRVASDSENVERVYNALSKAGLKVWWDKMCLQPGVSWEEGFCDGLVKSRVFMPLLSRGAINHPTKDGQSFSRKTVDSPCDNVLLEHLLALELQSRGLVEKIYPLMLGDLVPIEGTEVLNYENYFATGCHPSAAEVEVVSVQKKLNEHLHRQCLGSALLERMTVKKVLDSLTINQGKIVTGHDDVWAAVVSDVQKMLSM